MQKHCPYCQFENQDHGKDFLVQLGNTEEHLYMMTKMAWIVLLLMYQITTLKIQLLNMRKPLHNLLTLNISKRSSTFSNKNKL